MATRMLEPVQSLIGKLTNPPVETPDVEARLQMQLSSTLLLLQTILIIIIVLIYAPINGRTPTLTAALVYGIISGLGYAVSRTSYYRIGIFAYIIVTIATIFALFLSYPKSIPEYSLSYLSTILFIASLLLSVRYVLILALATLLGLAALPLVSPDIHYTISYIWLYTLVMSILIAIATLIRQNVLTRLRSSEMRARNLMEAYFDALAIYSHYSGFLDVNPAFTQLLGYELDDVIDKSTEKIVADKESLQVILKQEGKSNPEEVRLRHKNGDVIEVEWISQPYTYQDKPARVALVRDMRRYKAALRQQYEQAVRYETLLEQTHDAVFITDFDGVYQALNQQAADMFRITIEEGIGKSYRDFVPTVYHNASSKVITRLLKGELVPIYERTFIRKNGARFPAEVMVKLMRDMDGNPQYVHSIVRDISERKHAEDQRVELAIERERMKLLQEFLRDASHYFRTPLTSLKTSVYLLRRLVDNPEKQEQYQAVMEIEIARLERLLSDMMLSTQLERDSGNGLTFGRLDVAQVLKEIIETYKPVERRDAYATIRLDENLHEKTLYIMASRSKFSEAMRRLLDNAVMYSPPDSEITVRAYAEDQLVCIEVEDKGIGITSEEMSLLFKRFARADRAVEVAHVGNGLGLSIAEKIIEMHYGDISVRSVPDEGSIFKVKMPIALRSKIHIADETPRSKPEDSPVE